MRISLRSRLAAGAVATTALGALAACYEPPATAAANAAAASGARVADRAATTQRQYGPSVPVGDGRVRAYVVYDRAAGDAPIEIGVAMDERAMEGLPGLAPASDDAAHAAHATGAAAEAPAAARNPHDHGQPSVWLLDLPQRGAAPYQFVAFDWNPGGHVPPGVYDVPHFDFHFWTVSKDERAAIVPSDPRWAERAARLPAEAARPPYFVVAAPPGTPPEAVAVPEMGVHWADMRTPELQPPGSPAHRPFTTTMLWGSWDGRFTFIEPMITRAYLLAKKSATDAAVRDEIIPLEMPAQLPAPGYYPGAYRITWDAQAREYRVALTRLARRD